MSRRLIFVYNAKSGFIHGIVDLVRKSASPKTYTCKLCSVTYSGAKIDRSWKQYLASLDVPSLFMYRDEFIRAYPSQAITFPAILLENKGSLCVLVSSEEFKSITNLSDLIQLLNKKLRNIRSAKDTKGFRK